MKLSFSPKLIKTLAFSALSVGLSSQVNANQPLSFHNAISHASGSVVNISTSRSLPESNQQAMLFRYFNDQPYMPAPKRNNLGSGCIISKSGYIVTNDHVIKGAHEIKVELSDHRVFSAQIIGEDPDTDLAVIKINAAKIQPIQMTPSANTGEFVLAIGNAFGLNQTVTQGIISATGRNNLGINRYENFIQTDAAINPGNSGGPLINTEGKMVGINTAIVTRSGGNQGIGFAIPSNTVKRVMTELIKTGSVSRGWLGLSVKSIDPEIAKTLLGQRRTGILIVHVEKNSPAIQSGLTRGDIITSVNRQDIIDLHQFMQTIANFQPQDSVSINYLRHGKSYAASVTLGKRPTHQQTQATNSLQQYGRPQ